LAKPTQGICDASAKAGKGVLVQGNVLVESGEYLDGEVLYQGDRIVCVGCDCASAPGAEEATGTPRVTGVMHYRFNRRRIAPRNADDITP
jgi:hypothetical protein